MENRREFLVKSALGLAVGILAPKWLEGAPSIISSYNKPNSKINGVQVGCITYSFRSMADQSAEAILQYVKDCGINAIELMGDPAETFAGKPILLIDQMKMYQLGSKQRRGELLTDLEKLELAEMRAETSSYNLQVIAWRNSVNMKKFEQLGKMFNDSGVTIYAFKPDAFGPKNSEAEITYGMRAASALGASHVTLEHPSDDGHTMKLGKIGEKNDMSVGYHGHEQETFTFWDNALAQSLRNALNLDVGHYIAAGHLDLIPLIEKHHARILSMHVKDRQTPANGKGNLIWGMGDTPIGEILQLMKRKKHLFPATIELEYQIPERSDAVKEVQRCLAFCENALS